MIKKTVGVIIYKNNKVLVEQRLNKPYKYYWTLPGGHIEKGESHIDAAKREVFEETNLKINPVFIEEIKENLPSINWQARLHLFKATTTNEPTPDGKEVAKIKWITKKDISSLRFGFKHKEILEKYL